MTIDRRSKLEEERRFLLTSIRDLDREHAAGDVDDDDHRVLRDGYVARAAAVLRQIEHGTEARRHRRSPWRTALTVVATVAAAVAFGLAVPRFAGQRLPGQSITGGPVMDQVTDLLAAARQSLSSDPTASLAAYDRVLEIEPANAEAVTYRAWLLVLGGRGAGDETIVRSQLAELRRATTLDDEYADPHCLLAVATGRFLDPPDTEVSRVEAQACLERNPPAALRPAIEALLVGD